MNKKIKEFLIYFLIILSIIPIFKFLINNRKIRFVNEIYFNSPFLVNSKNICKKYQDLLDKTLNQTYSVTVINDKGTIIASYNGDKLRIPASNLKLFSTAYALDKLSFKDLLSTSIFTDNLNNFYLLGTGDPDLSAIDIKTLLKNVNFKNNFNFYILEVNKKTKWPDGWTEQDKIYNYGSPITSLALNSNQNKYQDIYFVKDIIENYFIVNYPIFNYKLKIIEYDKNLIKNLKLTSQIPSNPILSFVTLANSESHNFTAESLFKNASKSWNNNKYNKIKGWLRLKGLPVKDIYINDASGLSRDNRLTTDLTALFLHKMRYSKQFDYFNSSLSIMGVRGTLANRMRDTILSSKFFGKTGTLSNVFALSGYLYKNNEVLSISIIQNSNYINSNKTFNLLKKIYDLDNCLKS